MIYLTADTHLGCANLVANTRPMYSNVEEHDEAVLDGINRTVGKYDSLFILGDFCYTRVAAYRMRLLPRHVFFILGNHDKPNEIAKSFGGHVWTSKMIKLGEGVKIWCHHFPLFSWEKSHNGAYHAYGHLHYNRRLETMMNQGMPGRRSADVGIDAAWHHFGEHRPFTTDEFLHILRARPGHDLVPVREKWSERDY